MLPNSEDSSPKPKAECIPTGHETILVVEDEIPVRLIISHTLRHQGYEVLEACDGQEALQIWSVKGGEVDLLLTDVVMPNGLHGPALAGRLMNEKQGLKVIFSSGNSPDLEAEGAALPRATDFLQKPYRSEALARAVRKCLDR